MVVETAYFADLRRADPVRTRWAGDDRKKRIRKPVGPNISQSGHGPLSLCEGAPRLLPRKALVPLPKDDRANSVPHTLVLSVGCLPVAKSQS